MKKFIITFIAATMFATVSFAEDFSVNIAKTNPWGQAKFDSATKTMTFSKAWQGCGWWLNKDCSKFEQVEIKFAEKLPVGATFMVIYKEKDEKGGNIKQKISIPAGSKEATIKLDSEMKSAVNGLGFSVKAAGEVVLKSITIEE